MAFKIKDLFRIGTKDVANSAGDLLAPNVLGTATVRAAATQDGVALAGRAGGTNDYDVTLTPTTLTGDQVLTLPNASGTVALTSQLPTDTNTTYTLDGSGSANSVNLELVAGGSGSGTDTINVVGAGATTVAWDEGNQRVTITSTDTNTTYTAASTVVAETSYGQASAVGISAAYARADHTHGTPATTKDTTAVTGLLKGNGSTISAAVSGTDYAAAIHSHGTYDDNTALTGANVFSNIQVTDGIVQTLATRALTAADVGAAASSHTQAETTITFTDVTTGNATTANHGFLPKLGGGTSNFLRADGSWATPPDSNTDTLQTIANSTAAAEYYVTFVVNATGAQSGLSSTNLKFNPSTGTLTVGGDLVVEGATTTLNTANLLVEDKNIVLANGSSTDAAADGGGITLKGATDKTLTWSDVNDAWTSSEHLFLADQKNAQINNGSLVLAPASAAKIWTRALAPANLTVNTAVGVDSFASATYRSAKYTIQLTQGTKYQLHEVRLVHDGSLVYLTDYAVVESNGASPIPVTFSAAIATGTLSLNATVTDAATTNVAALIERTLFAA